MKIVSFLIAFVIFSIVILFHELGHFLLAKANGIRVNDFCFGLGPTICGIQKGETKYCIKAFPFGGACMMEGEDEDSTDNRAFGKKPVWGRMSVVFAGPFFNFILAFIFAFILMSCVSGAAFYGIDELFPCDRNRIYRKTKRIFHDAKHRHDNPAAEENDADGRDFLRPDRRGSGIDGGKWSAWCCCCGDEKPGWLF